MAGMTDTAFRRLVKRQGGCGLVVTEMVSSEGLVRGIDRTLEYAEHTEAERPVSIQIFGGDPVKIADAAHIVSEALLELFTGGEFDVATLFFSRFRSVISQVPTAAQLIPAKAPEGVTPPDLKGAVYEYEPSEEEILEALLPQYLNGQILQALLENQAGFYGAQMSAMDSATRNAGDLIRKLTLRYNRQRQANITKELIEIISGAEAL